MTIATDKLVAGFATALRQKLVAAEEKYGYEDSFLQDNWEESMRADLRKHLEKGDPIDVAAYCAFAWHHKWGV